MNCNVLVVDDERSIRWVLEKTISRASATPHIASNLREAMEILESQAIDMAFVDIHLQQESGLAFTEEVLRQFPSSIDHGDDRSEHNVQHRRSHEKRGL